MIVTSLAVALDGETLRRLQRGVTLASLPTGGSNPSRPSSRTGLGLVALLHAIPMNFSESAVGSTVPHL